MLATIWRNLNINKNNHSNEHYYFISVSSHNIVIKQITANEFHSNNKVDVQEAN